MVTMHHNSGYKPALGWLIFYITTESQISAAKEESTITTL